MIYRGKKYKIIKVPRIDGYEDIYKVGDIITADRDHEAHLYISNGEKWFIGSEFKLYIPNNHEEDHAL